jgi:hypothetical protein
MIAFVAKESRGVEAADDCIGSPKGLPASGQRRVLSAEEASRVGFAPAAFG